MTDRDHSHEVEMEISLDGCSSFSFENTEQRIISSYIVLMINSSEVTDMIGNQLTNEFKTKIDANTGFGSISGSALKLKLMLDIFMQTATDVSLSFDKSSFVTDHEDHQFFCLFEDLQSRVSSQKSTSLTYLEMMSRKQRADVAKAAFDFSQSLPFIYRYQEIPDFAQ